MPYVSVFAYPPSTAESVGNFVQNWAFSTVKTDDFLSEVGGNQRKQHEKQGAFPHFEMAV